MILSVVVFGESEKWQREEKAVLGFLNIPMLH